MIEEKKEEKNQKFDVEQLYRIIQEGSNKIKGNINKATIVIGQTGVGKSTIINGLTEKLQKIKKKRLSYIIQLADGQQGAKIGSTCVSETSFPIAYLDKQNNTYWDCPGFEDSKGPSQDIANGFFIKKIFDNTKKLKILLILNHNYFKSDRDKQIRQIVKKLSNLFKSLQNSLPGIILIVNKGQKKYKQQDYKDCFDGIIAQAQQFAKQSKKEIFQGSQKMIYSYFKQKSVILKIDQPTEIGQFKIEKTIIQNIQKIPYIDSPSINIPISESSKVYLYQLSAEAKNKIIIKNKRFAIEIQRYLDNLVKKSEYQSLFTLTQQMVQIYQLTKNILMPSVINNSLQLGTNTQYDKLVQKILAYFYGINYSLKKQIQIYIFCKDVLREQKQEILKQIKSIWELIQKIAQACAKRIINRIQVQYNRIVNYFIRDLNGEIQKIKNDKKELQKIQERLNKFSLANKIQVIPELVNILQRTSKQSTYNLMKIHHDVKNINKILNLAMSINILEASQTVKNHLNEKLNQIRKYQKDIYISECSVKTMCGQNTDLIISQDITYHFINQYSKNYLSLANNSVRMSYPQYVRLKESNLEILKANKYSNSYIIGNDFGYLTVYDLEIQRELKEKQRKQKQYQNNMELMKIYAQNNTQISPLLFSSFSKYPQYQKKKKYPQQKVISGQSCDSDAFWQFNLLKTGFYNIIHKNTGYFLKSNRSTSINDSVELGLVNDGQSINWQIIQNKN